MFETKTEKKIIPFTLLDWYFRLLQNHRFPQKWTYSLTHNTLLSSYLEPQLFGSH